MGVQCHVIGGCGKLRPNFCERQEQMEQLNTLSHYNSQLSGHRSIENVGQHNIRLQLTDLMHNLEHAEKGLTF